MKLSIDIKKITNNQRKNLIKKAILHYQATKYELDRIQNNNALISQGKGEINWIG